MTQAPFGSDGRHSRTREQPQPCLHARVRIKAAREAFQRPFVARVDAPVLTEAQWRFPCGEQPRKHGAHHRFSIPLQVIAIRVAQGFKVHPIEE